MSTVYALEESIKDAWFRALQCFQNSWKMVLLPENVIKLCLEGAKLLQLLFVFIFQSFFIIVFQFLT